MTEGVGIGTAIVSYIEPHAGAERDFNRWYERDHFPAAVLAGPGAYAGARFVATRACKDARLDGDLFGDPRTGSYLSIAWLLPGAQAGVGRVDPRPDGNAARRGPHVRGTRSPAHRRVRVRWEARAADGGPPRRWRSNAASPVSSRSRSKATRRRARSKLGGLASIAELPPVIVALRRERLLVSVLGEPAPHLLLLAFVDGDVDRRLAAHARRARARLGADVGFAGPFLATVPGTDTYVDEL